MQITISIAVEQEELVNKAFNNNLEKDITEYIETKIKQYQQEEALRNATIEQPNITVISS